MSQPIRKRDPDATRQAILDTAQELFVEHGMDAVSMRQISLVSGVTKSLIHHHFQTKDQLWIAVKERMFGEFISKQMGIFESMPGSPNLLRNSLRAYFAFVREHPEIVRLWTWTLLDGDCSAAIVERGLIQQGVAKIAEAQANGSIRNDVDPLFLIAQFVGMTNQWFLAHPRYLAWAGYEEQPDDWDDRFIEQFENVFIDGIATPQESST